MNPTPVPELVERLRNRVLTALHTGWLAPGDRLASVRTVAEEFGAHPRAVMQAYHRLREEGLVDIRPRSGVFLASNDSPSPAVFGETARWVAEELALGAWRRRIPLPDLPGFLHAWTHGAHFTCACVDEIEDDRLAICNEIGQDFGMAVRPIAPMSDGTVRLSGDRMTLDAALSDSDLVVVTAYHEREVRPIADGLGLPVVVSTFNPVGREEVLALREEHGALTFVVLDDRASRRLREAYGDDLRLLALDEIDDLHQIDGTLVFTPAAAGSVPELPEGSMVPQTPLMSHSTARDLAGWLVQLNLQRVQEEAPDVD